MSKYLRPLFKEIASVCGARKRCLKNGNEFAQNHDDTLDFIEKNLLPHGSGIDSGCTIDREKSGDEIIVIGTSYHHMAESGMYDGWTEHKITIRPSFHGVDISIGGRNRNEIKDYLHDVFGIALTDEIDWDDDEKQWYSVSMRAASERYKAGIADGTIV